MGARRDASQNPEVQRADISTHALVLCVEKCCVDGEYKNTRRSWNGRVYTSGTQKRLVLGSATTLGIWWFVARAER